MSKNSIKTQTKIASTASKLLRKAKSKKVKSLAGSGLSNAKEDSKPKKK